MGVKDIWCEFWWKIIFYMAVALSESVDSSPHGRYICFIACKVITIFLFGLPHEAIDTVANCYLYSTKREREREYEYEYLLS